MAKKTERVCIVHTPTVDLDERLISPQTYESWLTLLEAATIRNFTPVLNVAKDLEECEVPLIFYHRTCPSIFTMKRDLETLKRKSQEDHDVDYEGNIQQTTKKRSLSSNSRVYSEVCVFCGKERYVHSSNSREKLVKATQLRVDKTLREKVLAKCDEKILAVTSEILLQRKRITTDPATETTLGLTKFNKVAILVHLIRPMEMNKKRFVICLIIYVQR